MEKIVPIHHVQDIDVTIDSKVGIQRKAQHPVITPFADLVVDVEQERIINVSRILEPELARSLPNIHAPIGFESDSDRVGPWSRDCSFSKTRRHRRCEEITPDGARAYVSNALSNNVSVIDTSTNTVVATVPVENDPRPLG